MKYVNAFILMVFFGTVACQKTDKTAEHLQTNPADSTTVFQPPAVIEKIAPGQCRLVGKVVETGNPVMIAVEKIIGYGSGFNVPIAVGNRIPVEFAQSGTSSSDTVSQPPHPSEKLQPGDLIRTDIRRKTDTFDQLNSQSIVFIAFQFEKIQ
ncbi:MAG: hypothetical protein KDE57_09055 [Calditrichaeota bacterium]|nr:hypothetical protein [Calditrichota bacterium]